MEQLTAAPHPLRTAVLIPAQPTNSTHVADPSVRKKQNVSFLGVMAYRLRTATINLIMSVRQHEAARIPSDGF